MAKALFNMDQPAVADLGALIDVPEGGTVSKPLLADGGLRLILFAMDGGQIITEHRSPVLATVHVLTGRLRLTVAGQPHDLGPHGWVAMPPDAPHDLEALEPCRFLLTMMKVG